MIEGIIASFSLYYGLDWLCLVVNLVGSYLITKRNYWGFALSVVGCSAGFAVAYISSQYGFIIYNLLLIAMFTRGFWSWKTSSKNQSAAAE